MVRTKLFYGLSTTSTFKNFQKRLRSRHDTQLLTPSFVNYLSICAVFMKMEKNIFLKQIAAALLVRTNPNESNRRSAVQ